MIVTDDKIKVTLQMMVENNMINHDMYGVPVDPKHPSKGLKWRRLNDMTDEDFNLIEQYFMSRPMWPYMDKVKNQNPKL